MGTAPLEQNVVALNITLTHLDLDALTTAMPPGSVGGQRYPEQGMRVINR